MYNYYIVNATQLNGQKVTQRDEREAEVAAVTAAAAAAGAPGS